MKGDTTMPRKPKERPPIRTESYVHVGDKLVNTDDLNPVQKEKLGIWIKTTLLNSIYRGRYRFFPVDENGNEITIDDITPELLETMKARQQAENAQV